MVDFPGCLVSVAFAWSVVDNVGYGLAFPVADVGEIGALGEVLLDQPVGVLVAATQPRMVRRGEVTDRAARPFDLPEIGEFHAAVQGHGPAFWMLGRRLDLHIGDVPLGVWRVLPQAGRSTAILPAICTGDQCSSSIKRCTSPILRPSSGHLGLT